MAYYYYTGPAQAIPVTKGRSVAARHNSRIEIHDDGLPEVRRLIRQGYLKPCGKPKTGEGATKKTPVGKLTAADVPKTAFAKDVAYKGVSKKGAPPKPGKGEKVEHTQDEPKMMAAKEAEERAKAEAGAKAKGKGKDKGKNTGKANE